MPGAIRIGTPNTGANHCFDPVAVGAGCNHTNTSPTDLKELQVSIRVEASGTDPKLLVTENPAVSDVECVVDTGATVSLFKAEVAMKLELNPDDGDIDDEALEVVGGRFPCSRCTRNIYLKIGAESIPVKVQFPVELLDRWRSLILVRF